MTSYKLVMPGDLNHYGFLIRRQDADVGGQIERKTSVFTTDITFVRVDKDGSKLPIPEKS